MNDETKVWNPQFLLENEIFTPEMEDELVQYYIETYTFAENAIMFYLERASDRYKLLNVTGKLYKKHKLILIMLEASTDNWCCILGKIDDFDEMGILPCSKEEYIKNFEAIEDLQARQDYLNNVFQEFAHP